MGRQTLVYLTLPTWMMNECEADIDELRGMPGAGGRQAYIGDNEDLPRTYARARPAAETTRTYSTQRCHRICVSATGNQL